MKKGLLVSALFAFVASCFASTLNVMDGSGVKVGTATFTFTKSAAKLSTRIVMTLNQQGAKVTLDMTDTYSSTGNPLQQILKMKASMQGTSFDTTSKVTFNGRKASVTTTAMGKSQTKSATAPGTVTDSSVLWMTGKVPAVGTTATCYKFDPMDGAWSKSTNTYHGLRTVKTASKSVSAHVISSKDDSDTTKVYFTKTGDLVKLETKEFTLIQQ
jgi:hypothetical protein